MAQTTLTFAPDGARHKATWTSTGAGAVLQVERDGAGPLEIRAYLDGMTPLTVAKDYAFTPPSVIMQLDIPAGVKVDIVSDTAVTAAAILDGTDGTDQGEGA